MRWHVRDTFVCESTWAVRAVVDEAVDGFRNLLATVGFLCPPTLVAGWRAELHGRLDVLVGRPDTAPQIALLARHVRDLVVAPLTEPAALGRDDIAFMVLGDAVEAARFGGFQCRY